MSGSEGPGTGTGPVEGLDLRLVPVAATAWAGAWWGTGGTRWQGLGVVLGVAVCCGWLHRSGRTMQALAVLSCGLACAGMGFARQEQLSHSRPAELAAERATAVLVVQLTAEPVLHPRHGVLPESTTATARVLLVQGRGEAARQRVPVVLRASGALAQPLHQTAPGARLRVEGRLSPGQPGRQEAALLVVRTPPQLIAPPGLVDHAVNTLRAGLRASMRHSPPAQAGLLPSLVVGDTSGLDDSLSDAFRATALTHLTAVSGTNLTLMLAFLLGLARWAGVRGWWVRGVGLAGVVLFVVVCRAEPSVLRAGAMGLVALAGLGLAQGRAKGIRHLCVAIWLLVMVDPWLARSIGFALSSLATGGILWWGSRWRDAMAWAPDWLREAIAIPLAAQLSTQVVVTAISGQVSMVGLAANALAGPFVGPATVLGLAAALTSCPAPWLATALGWVAGWCVQPVIWIATAGGSLPAATWRWPSTTPMLLVLGVLCLAVAPLVPRLLASRVACLLTALALVAACLRPPRPLGWPGPWQATFCDVGQGDATALRAGDGQVVLVDTGPEAAPTLECLRALGTRRIAMLVLTHYHDDHIGGFAGVADAFPIGLLVVNPATSPAAGARRVQQVASEHGTPVRMAAVGDQLQVGEVAWSTVGVGAQEVLASSGEGESSAENDTSIVGVADVSGLRLVLGGDVEPAGQQRVVAAGWHPQLTVLKMPHHGSSRQDERFWCDSGAVLAVASAGYHNDYGHPAAAALRLASRCGMRVARTDLQGSIAVGRSPDGLSVHTQRDGPP